MASSLSSVQFRVVEVVVEGEVTYGDAAGAHHSIQICQTVVKLFQYRINCPQNLVNVVLRTYRQNQTVWEPAQKIL